VVLRCRRAARAGRPAQAADPLPVDHLLSPRRGGMSARDGRARGIVLVAGVALTVALALYLSYRNRDFQFEDGLIYQRYVRNWLAGAGLVYNRGERYNGLTSPFYSYLVMATAAVVRDVQLAVTLVAGAGLAAAIGLLAAVFARAADPLGAVLGALLVACCRYFY